MTIEQQVCTMQQGKRLKELGVEQGLHLFGQFHWFIAGSLPVITVNANTNGVVHSGAINHPEHFARAFTVAELGVALPFMLLDKGKPYPEYDFVCSRNYSDDPDAPTDKRLWSCAYQHDGTCIALFEPELTEAQARASMLIHLLENNIITPAEVNARLKGEDEE